MTHPNHDELAAFLYDDELPPARQAEIARHVDACEGCRATVDGWRGVRTNLAAWRMPQVPRAAATSRSGSARAGLRWAVAAVVLLASGFAVARITEKPAVDLADLRAELAREVRQEVRQELAAELTNHAAQQVQWQRSFQQAVVDEIARLETRQVTNYTSLRKDVETVALRTEEEFGRLASASYAAPQAAQ